MAKHLTLNAQTRLTTGRTAVKKIKAQGLVPAVVYGGHVELTSQSMPAKSENCSVKPPANTCLSI